MMRFRIASVLAALALLPVGLARALAPARGWRFVVM
jgi:hypothetical protein